MPSPNLFPPIDYGPLRIEYPVLQAALSGYSDRPMRVLAREQGAGGTVAEVMLDKFVVEVSTGSKARRYLAVKDEDHPVGAQIMGGSPEPIAEAAARLVSLGFDFIDLNFGCPVPKVVAKGRGGALLKKPDEALEIVARVREKMPAGVPLSVKLRRAMDDSPEARDAFDAILEGVFDHADAVTIHGRTVRQRYEGVSDWDFLADAKRRAGGRIVLGSGDLFAAEDGVRMRNETKVDGLTIARGAIGNPWIFREVRALSAGEPLPAPPTLHEQRDVIARHYDMVEQLYGERRGCAVMRKFGIRYAWLHPASETVRAAFIQVRTRDDWQAVLARNYADDLPGKRPPREAHTGLGIS